ncbi:5'-nucleotidase / UDP-sugar diphosphatase [Ferrimonas sediminum]|uniref:5'-nucleotidase / UDP-sugar diphosphatase n=1 Tax=Ferrimonas sediminum TaxID=718193 RepID=A0A1G8QIX4_9GAMM|nr:bifunctional UDP-sugar hydrolase/5'-nucleotidase UshA [Ferrimonas sediminum]SDJ04606.1 5'-nucleotidase / UDP-sugar diphosphatase [Ferrimonas sediminum]
MMKLQKSLIAVSLLAALTACSDDNNTPAPEVCGADNCTKFTILHTNDNHGRFWENGYGEYGMAARKTLVDQIRDEVERDGGYSLLLSGGDINTGVPESDLQDAKPDFIGMNMIGYDAMAVGNHEFDNPLDVLENQRDWADFPMLAANIYDADGERYFQPYKIFTLGDLRIAVVGLTTEDTVKIGNPNYISELTFTDPKEELKKVIAEIEESKSADLVFATTHMGHYANGDHASNAPGDVALARAMQEGQLAAVIGGHSQNPVCMSADGNSYDADFAPGSNCKPDQQNGTWIMQAHEWGKYVGRADFEYFGGQLHLASYKLMPVNLAVYDGYSPAKDDQGNIIRVAEEIKPDSFVKETLRPYQEAGQEKLDVVIGSTDLTFVGGDRSVVRARQAAIGQLLISAQRTHPQINADFGIMNGGGIRADIAAGDISYRHVLKVQPFGNVVSRAAMKGSELTSYLASLATIEGAGKNGGYAHFSNIEMTVNCGEKSVEIEKINGENYDATKEYTFSIPDFSAAGGDGYPKIDVINTGLVDADILRNYVETNSPLSWADYEPQGEVEYVNNDSGYTGGCGAAPAE